MSQQVNITLTVLTSASLACPSPSVAIGASMTLYLRA